MKIRCIDNHVRYRVRKSDIEKLREEQKCSGEVGFGGDAVFRYTLVVNGEGVTAYFKNGEIVIGISNRIFKEWADTNAVGITERLTLDGDNVLEVLIEKDFPCKDRDEDVSDTFFELNEGDAC